MAEGIGAFLHIVVYLVIGILAATAGFGDAGWRLAVFVGATLLVARPVAILLSFLGLSMPPRERAYIAWFGPKAVASLYYALVVIGTTTPHRVLVAQATIFTVLASVVLHSSTPSIATRWLTPAGEAAGHLDVHRDVPGDEHHRSRLRREPLAGLQRDDDGGGLPFASRARRMSAEASRSLQQKTACGFSARSRFATR